MTSDELRHWLLLNARLYRVLLLMCPGDFRELYGTEMERLFRERLRDAHLSGKSRVVIRVWIRIITDLLQTVAREWFSTPARPRLRLLAAVASAATALAGLWLVSMEFVLLHPGFAPRAMLACIIVLMSLGAGVASLTRILSTGMRVLAGVPAALLLVSGLLAMTEVVFFNLLKELVQTVTF